MTLSLRLTPQAFFRLHSVTFAEVPAFVLPADRRLVGRPIRSVSRCIQPPNRQKNFLGLPIHRTVTTQSTSAG